MGFRFRKRLRIIPGFLWVNVSKKGASLSVGGHGATINLNRKGAQGTVGLPGSGISYRTRRRKIGTSSPANCHASDTTSTQARLLELVLELRQ
jgi:hypothetical protein